MNKTTIFCSLILMFGLACVLGGAIILFFPIGEMSIPDVFGITLLTVGISISLLSLTHLCFEERTPKTKQLYTDMEDEN